jgi:hypothetical protein
MEQSFLKSLASAQTTAQVEQLSKSFFDMGAHIEIDHEELNADNFASSDLCWEFFGVYDWAENIGLLSNPNGAERFCDLIMYASPALRAEFLSEYNAYISELTAKTKTLAQEAYYERIREQNWDLLQILNGAEKDAAKRFFNPQSLTQNATIANAA